jgi:hypothetical protein
MPIVAQFHGVQNGDAMCILEFAPDADDGIILAVRSTTVLPLVGIGASVTRSAQARQKVHDLPDKSRAPSQKASLLLCMQLAIGASHPIQPLTRDITCECLSLDLSHFLSFRG